MRAPNRTHAAIARLLACLLLLWSFRAAGAEEAYLRYKVEIEAPKRLAGVLRADLDLVRWEGYETMTPELLERLVREARTEAAEILAAHGYFSPVIESRIEGEGASRIVRLSVDPGAPTRVRSVELRVTGPMAQGDAADREAIARTESEWKLAAGETFTQGAWDAAKRAALESVARRRYLTARISESEARIDPASQAAQLRVTIASGPAIALGELEIVGLQKYDPALVRNLWTFEAGTDYDRELIERFQRRVTAVEYFDSVLVDADPARIAGGRVPVRVTLHEAPEKRLQLGANFSTDSGLGGFVGYQNRNFLGRALRLGTRIDLQQKLQTAEATIGLPERPGGWADQYALRLRHTLIENLDTREASVGWRRSSIEERRQPYYGLTLAFSEQRAGAVLDESVHATYAYFGYTWRTTDHLLSPRQGMITQVEAGVAPPGVSTRGFGRTIGRIAWYHPLGPQRDLLVQLQGGAVLAGSSSGIPQQFLFRTGGSTTVRGYDLDSLGVVRDNAVLGGRAFALASVEATQWLNETFGVAVFVDAGNAADRFRDLRAAYGVGAGVRMRTPLGPFRLDVAYGEQRQSWRLHFSIGLSF